MTFKVRNAYLVRNENDHRQAVPLAIPGTSSDDQLSFRDGNFEKSRRILTLLNSEFNGGVAGGDNKLKSICIFNQIAL